MKKSLKINYFYNLFYQVLIMILPLIITPYVSRVLGANNIGIYSYTHSIVSYFVLFGCMGINLYGQRLIASVQDDKNKRSKYFYELFLLKFTTILLSIILFSIFYSNCEYSLYYRILIIELISNILDISWFYQGLEDFKKITLRNTFVRVITLICIFIFVKDKSDLINYFLIYTLSNFLGFGILWLNIKKYLVKIKIKIKDIIIHLKPTLSFFIPQIAIQIYTVLDKTMIGYIVKDMSEVGYYEQSQKIIKTCLMIVTALGTVMIPRIANLYANNKIDELKDKIYKTFNVVSLISFPICFGIIGVSNNFVPWFFGKGYFPIINLLIIFSFLIIAIGFSNITGMQYLITTGEQKIFTISVVLGAILNFIVNLLFIPMFKANGAAISSVLAEFLILFIHLLYLRKIFDIKKIIDSNIKYLIYSLIMFVIVLFIGYYLENCFKTLIIQIVFGVITYFILLLISKDAMLLEALNIVKTKIKILRK